MTRGQLSLSFHFFILSSHLRDSLLFRFTSFSYSSCFVSFSSTFVSSPILSCPLSYTFLICSGCLKHTILSIGHRRTFCFTTLISRFLFFVRITPSKHFFLSVDENCFETDTRSELVMNTWIHSFCQLLYFESC